MKVLLQRPSRLWMEMSCSAVVLLSKSKEELDVGIEAPDRTTLVSTVMDVDTGLMSARSVDVADVVDHTVGQDLPDTEEAVEDHHQALTAEIIDADVDLQGTDEVLPDVTPAHHLVEIQDLHAEIPDHQRETPDHLDVTLDLHLAEIQDHLVETLEHLPDVIPEVQKETRGLREIMIILPRVTTDNPVGHHSAHQPDHQQDLQGDLLLAAHRRMTDPRTMARKKLNLNHKGISSKT